MDSKYFQTNANCLEKNCNTWETLYSLKIKECVSNHYEGDWRLLQKLKPPMAVKGCRSFVGMVNFLSIFCPELQKLLKPIYDLTRKGRQFVWVKEQQTAFEKIKSRLQKPPVLYLPDSMGRFHLYSDTSRFITHSALYQIQNGKPKLITYASKRLPEAAQNYSVIESELCGLDINIASFTHLLKRVDFDAIMTQLALTNIIKSKVEPAITLIKRLLEILSSYSFNLYYIIYFFILDLNKHLRTDKLDVGAS